AKDAARPFVVFAGDTQVRAVGTSFSVRLLPDAPVQVLVREGVVEVTRQPTGAPPQVLKLAANMTVQAAGAAPMVPAVASPEDVERKLAWRNGMIDFDTTSLSQAAAEFARYSDYALTVDPDVAGERITGRFSASDPKGFATAAAVSLGIRVELGPTSGMLYR
ncbi:MAG: iron dicitrate transport regulator FecR, partial [Caulobacteraceae bacterium]